MVVVVVVAGSADNFDVAEIEVDAEEATAGDAAPANGVPRLHIDAEVLLCVFVGALEDISAIDSCELPFS